MPVPQAGARPGPRRRGGAGGGTRGCVVVGDIGADVGAAVAAGARAVLVPTPVTRPEEVATAARMPGVVVVTDLAAAAEHVLDLVGDPAAVDAGHGTPGDPDHPTALAARPEAAR